MFIQLTAHSSYSLQEGLLSPFELVQAARERGMMFAKGFREFLESNDERTIKKGSGQALDQPGTHGYQLGDDEFIIGSPEQVAEQIIDQCRIGGVGNFQVVFSGHGDLDQLTRSWEMFGQGVIPRLNQAELTAELKRA